MDGTLNRGRRDTTYLVAFLAGAGLLLFLGRGLLQSNVLVTWGLTFGGTAAAAVLVASLYRVRLDLQASRNQLMRREAELKFALEVQKSLYPENLPHGGGLEFSAVCIPAQGIGGDYYDVVQLPDGRLIFAIGDVSGKGIPAAILMANLQALLRTISEIGGSPADVCSRLNRHLHKVTGDSRFATFFYADWDPVKRRLKYVNAGHLAPVLQGSCCGLRLERGGLPLGLFPDASFEIGEFSLSPGDVLVLFSDGITEATSNRDEQFGERRLQEVLTRHWKKPLFEIQASILEAVQNWSPKDQEDDMTLLLVRALEPNGTGKDRPESPDKEPS